jgi:hypothetical protein
LKAYIKVQVFCEVPGFHSIGRYTYIFNNILIHLKDVHGNKSSGCPFCTETEKSPNRDIDQNTEEENYDYQFRKDRFKEPEP